MTSKHPGRPIDKSNKPALRRLEIWLHIEMIRARYHEVSGRRPSVTSVVGWIVKHGGMGSAIGGNIDAILLAMDPKHGRKTLQATRRTRKIKLNGSLTLVDDQHGMIIVMDLQRNSESLRQRYYEAMRMLQEDPKLRAEFDNQLADRLGSPRPHGMKAERIGRRQ